MTFKSLPVGAVFEFDSIKKFPYSGFARGPWVKTSVRGYRKQDDNGLKYKVGSVSAGVERIASNPRRVKLPSKWTNAKVRVDGKGNVQIGLAQNPLSAKGGKPVKNVKSVNPGKEARRKRAGMQARYRREGMGRLKTTDQARYDYKTRSSFERGRATKRPGRKNPRARITIRGTSYDRASNRTYVDVKTPQFEKTYTVSGQIRKAQALAWVRPRVERDLASL